MADVASAIRGVRSRSVKLISTISAFCKSTDKAPPELHEIESDLELLGPALLQIEELFLNADNVRSEAAERDLRNILDRCRQNFSGIETLLAPYQESQETSEDGPDSRKRWRFKAEDARNLGEMMEKIRATLHCMISIINLGDELSNEPECSGQGRPLNHKLSRSLRKASELVAGRKMVPGKSLSKTRQLADARAGVDYRLNSTRMSSWIAEVVGISDEEDSTHSTIQSGKTNVTLSAEHRSITKEATPEVEMLLERWTTFSETRSRKAHSVAENIQKDSGPSTVKDLEVKPVSPVRTVEPASSHANAVKKEPSSPVETQGTASLQIPGTKVELPKDRPRRENSGIMKSSARHEVEGSSSGSSVTITARPKSSHGPLIQRSRARLPILRAPYDDDDNETIRALGRIARGPKVRILTRVTEIPDNEDSPSRLENWLDQSENAEPVEERVEQLTIRSQETDAMSVFSQASVPDAEFDSRSLFSQASILDNSTSDTMSVMSTMTHNLDPSDPRTVKKLFHIGNKRFRAKKWSEAADFYRQAYIIKRDAGNGEDEEGLRIKFKIGAVFGELNKYEGAERILAGVFDKQKELLGEDHTETLLTQHYYGRVLSRQSKWDEACTIYEPLWEFRKELLNDDSSADLAIRTGHELGRILNEIERFAEAAEVLGSVYPAAKTTLGEPNKITLSAGVELGKALRCSEREQDAAMLLDELFELCQQSRDQSDPLVTKCTHEVAMMRCQESKFEDAERLAREAWVSRTAAKGSTDVGTLESAECLAKALYGIGRVKEAQDLLEEVYHHVVARLGREHVRSLNVGKDLGRLLLERLDAVDEDETAPSESAPSEIDQVEVEEPNLQRSERSPRRHRSRKSSSGSIDWYITERYPLLKPLLQIDPLSESPRRERTSNRNELTSRLATLEDAAAEAPALQSLAKALLVVSSVFKAFHARMVSDDAPMPNAFQFAEELGPQQLRLIAELEKPSPPTIPNASVVDGIKLGLALNEKRHASNVYQLIYSARKGELGAESERTLAIGHEYACLCLQINSFQQAELVLREVWVRRQTVLGVSNPQTLETGFQLGQVYFRTDRHDTALDLHQSVYQHRRELFGVRSVETIQSAEIYGQILMCRGSTAIQMQEGWMLLHQTLEIRKDVFGVTTDTVVSALRLAAITAISGKFSQSGELFTWLYEVGVDSVRRPGQFGYSPSKLAAGFAAAGMAFLDRNETKGNRLLEQIREYGGEVYGTTSAETQLITYLQAFSLFLQRRGRRCKSVLRHVFEMRKQTLGRRHPGTKAAGIILAMGILLDSLLSKNKIDDEIDEINDWLLNFDRSDEDWTFVMQFCQIGSVIATMYDLEDLSKVMLSWLYKTQKRRKGLFNRETLGTLVLNHGLSLYTMYRRRSKKIPTRERTKRDPRVFIRELWPAGIQMVTDLLAGVNQMPFFAETLPNFLQNSTMWGSFAPRQFTAHFFSIFAPVYEQLAPVDAGSRIWTIATDDDWASTIGENRGREPNGTSSIDFRDLDGRASDHLSSLGHSLLNLTLPHSSVSSFSELDAEREMNSLQDELVGEFVTDAGITAATSDIETLKREMEA
ncbi:hypothetical protein EG329_006434 [Mollisiaceae sp. DMI_Dod_QoI]|nr:hypothetical protein EG329_006434 [Helotiales sp. DMI_Dod_QoI]